MTYWRKPLYTIETEFGTLYTVDEKDADAIVDYLQSSDHPMKFIRRRESSVPDWGYIVGMVFLTSVVIVGLAYLFGG